MTVEWYLNSTPHGDFTISFEVWVRYYWYIVEQLNYKFLSVEYFTFIYLKWWGKRDNFVEIMDRPEEFI